MASLERMQRKAVLLFVIRFDRRRKSPAKSNNLQIKNVLNRDLLLGFYELI